MAFTVSTPRSVEVLAKQHSVPLVSSKIIYSLIDDIRSRVIQLLPPIIETKVTGEANISQLFEIQLKSKKTMKVAGCRVTNGVVDKSKHVRVVRNRETIFEGMFSVHICPAHSNHGCFFGRSFGYHEAPQKRHHGSGQRVRVWPQYWRL